MRSELVRITPELAQEMLDKNGVNRRLRTRDVLRYAADMRAGLWEDYNPDSEIVIDTDGNIKNGQHRLTGVVISGKTIGFVVWYDVPPDIKIYDDPAKRNAADYLKCGGYDATKEETSIARFVLMYIGGVKLPSQSQIGEYWKEKHENLKEAHRIATKGSNRPLCQRICCCAAVYCALEYGVSSNKLEEMFKITNTGFNESPRQYAAIVLRNQLLTPEYSTSQEPARINGEIITEAAIADYIKGNERRLKYNPKKAERIYGNFVKVKDKAIIERIAGRPKA